MVVEGGQPGGSAYCLQAMAALALGSTRCLPNSLSPKFAVSNTRCFLHSFAAPLYRFCAFLFLCRRSRLEASPGRQQGVGLARLQRLCEEVALGIVALQAAQMLQLLRRLDALCHHGKMQVIG